MNPSLVLLQSATMFAMAGAVLALSTYVTLWTGLLSFGTVTFAAIGAFGSVWLMTETGLGLWPAVVLGAAAAGAFGLLVGRVFLKLSSHWLALATVALVLITRVFVVNFGSSTGGSAGEVVPYTMSMPQMAALLVIVCVLLFALRRSKFGVAADATREDPAVAEALGIPVARVKIIAFGLSGAIGAVGGVMQASQLSYIGPDTFYVDLSVTVIACVVLGGAYHWAGSVLGAVVFTGLPVYISQYVTVGQSIINGVLLLAIIRFLPGGLVDPLRWRRRREKQRARSHPRVTSRDDGRVALENAGVTE
ncbi:branched-chain amino acid ABC transporter permease [Nocardia sp. BMG111209]|uniref:branched-chain amino acid ABC transporter permease n=1 Tax=Nocardia sp. BMG111209 TaxID=1160137 RepID=UPI000381266C|nr:branched-chain amino acid ABC transporter permease [Nocardia sp. BMG111209]